MRWSTRRSPCWRRGSTGKNFPGFRFPRDVGEVGSDGGHGGHGGGRVVAAHGDDGGSEKVKACLGGAEKRIYDMLLQNGEMTLEDVYVLAKPYIF